MSARGVGTHASSCIISSWRWEKKSNKAVLHYIFRMGYVTPRLLRFSFIISLILNELFLVSIQSASIGKNIILLWKTKVIWYIFCIGIFTNDKLVLFYVNYRAGRRRLGRLSTFYQVYFFLLHNLFDKLALPCTVHISFLFMGLSFFVVYNLSK